MNFFRNLKLSQHQYVSRRKQTDATRTEEEKVKRYVCLTLCTFSRVSKRERETGGRERRQEDKGGARALSWLPSVSPPPPSVPRGCLSAAVYAENQVVQKQRRHVLSPSHGESSFFYSEARSGVFASKSTNTNLSSPITNAARVGGGVPGLLRDVFHFTMSDSWMC